MKSSMPQARRQQGFGMLVFVLMISVVAFAIVIGYAGMMTHQEANDRPLRQQDVLKVDLALIDGYYRQHAADFDSASPPQAYAVSDVLLGAGVQARWGMESAWSPVLSADDGLLHRRLVLYFPTTTDSENPPDLATFASTGVFNSCTKADLACATRGYVIYDSLPIHRAALKETTIRLQRAAFKAQAYFKARMLQDPERNISVNYFRPPFGGCTPVGMDLDCLDTYTPLALDNGSGWTPQTNLPSILGLSTDETVSAWGDPIQASTKLDSETGDPPYTMVFRAINPFGGYITVRAIQQL